MRRKASFVRTSALSGLFFLFFTATSAFASWTHENVYNPSQCYIFGGSVDTDALEEEGTVRAASAGHLTAVCPIDRLIHYGADEQEHEYLYQAYFDVKSDGYGTAPNAYVCARSISSEIIKCTSKKYASSGYSSINFSEADLYNSGGGPSNGTWQYNLWAVIDNLDYYNSYNYDSFYNYRIYWEL